MLEEQNAAAQQYEAQAQGRNQQQRQNLPYTPRQNTRRRSGEIPPELSLQEQFRDFLSPKRDRTKQTAPAAAAGGSAGGSGVGGIDTAELQEQFNKFADSTSESTHLLMHSYRIRILALPSWQEDIQ